MTNQYLVFFDVDGTLIRIKSMFSFLKYYSRYKSKINNFKYYFYLIKTFILQKLGVSRELINQQYYKNFANEKTHEVMALGERWWRYVSSSNDLYNDKVVRELIKHRKNGAEIVFVSGSMPACIDPLAKELGAQHCLLTSLEVHNGYYTGKLNGISNINEGKRKRILEFINNYTQPIDLNQCFAYGDHQSDLPMLELVGNPVVVGKNKFLVEAARKQGWKIIH